MTRRDVIRMTGAAVGYAERPVVHDVDFTLSGGEVVAVLGPNGSGKSTLVRGILGLAPLLAGSLELFGVPAERFRDRARIGYVPQRHTVAGGIPSTVREVTMSGRLARKRALAPLTARDRAAVDAALHTVGLAPWADHTVAHLSGGQQRRVLIARALAADPDVLVMDEPTAGVDETNQAALAETLGRLVGGGVTLLLVAHELGPMRPLIARTVVLRDGRIVYDGPPAAATPADGDHHHLDETGPPGRFGLTG